MSRKTCLLGDAGSRAGSWQKLITAWRIGPGVNCLVQTSTTTFLHHGRPVAMAYYSPQQQQQPYGNAQNLQFYPSSYSNQPVSGTSTPFQAFNGGAQTSAYPSSYGAGFGGQSAVSGRMGEQGGLTMGWLAAFGTEGYPGEPPLLEELGVNFGHIKTKVCCEYTTA